MAHSPLPARALEHHAELTQMPEEAARISALLNKNLLGALRFDVAEIQKRAREIGAALQRVASAERGWGACYGMNQTIPETYEEILQHHRFAFLDFERLSHDLEINPSPRSSNIAALAADIERRLNLAEEAHERTFGLVSLTNQR